MLSTTSPNPNNRRTIITKVLVRLSCFVIAELWLNAVNLDTLADYHEFMQGRMALEVAQQQTITRISFNQAPALFG